MDNILITVKIWRLYTQNSRIVTDTYVPHTRNVFVEA